MFDARVLSIFFFFVSEYNIVSILSDLKVKCSHRLYCIEKVFE